MEYPVLEALHQAHLLLQLGKSFVSGHNQERLRQNRGHQHQLLQRQRADGCMASAHTFLRLEYQDGRKKKPQRKITTGLEGLICISLTLSGRRIVQWNWRPWHWTSAWPHLFRLVRGGFKMLQGHLRQIVTRIPVGPFMKGTANLMRMLHSICPEHRGLITINWF